MARNIHVSVRPNCLYFDVNEIFFVNPNVRRVGVGFIIEPITFQILIHIPRYIRLKVKFVEGSTNQRLIRDRLCVPMHVWIYVDTIKLNV